MFFVTTREFNAKVDARVAAILIAGSNVTITPTGIGQQTISSTGGGGGGGVAGVSTFNSRSGAVTPVKSDYSTWFVDLLGNYANPAWIASLVWSKISGTPTTMLGYGITDGLSATSSNTLTNKTINSANNVITITKDRVTGLQADLDAKESTITSLPATKGGTGFTSFSVGDILTAVSTTALQKRTQSQFKSDLSLDQVSNTSDITKNSATATLTNKTMSGASNTFSNIAQSAITGLTTALGLKLNVSDIGLQPQITLTYSAGASSWDMSLGVNAVITISGNVVITLTNFLTTYAPALRIIQTGLRGYTVTFVHAGSVIYYSGGVDGNDLSTDGTYRALATLRLVNNEIEASIDSTYTTTP